MQAFAVLGFFTGKVKGRSGSTANATTYRLEQRELHTIGRAKESLNAQP